MPPGVESTLSNLDPRRPLVIVDVDEVLGLFVMGFERLLADHGYELRLQRFALLGNIYRCGAETPVDIDTGRALYDEFFKTGVEDMEPAPHAAEQLAALSAQATIVILTNAPDHCRKPRARWLTRHGLDYPLMINEGPKGAAVAALAAQTSGPSAFVDDLLSNLDSAEIAAPHVRRFQLIADPRLRTMAPAAPDRHRRIDDWPTLGGEITRALDAAVP